MDTYISISISICPSAFSPTSVIMIAFIPQLLIGLFIRRPATLVRWFCVWLWLLTFGWSSCQLISQDLEWESEKGDLLTTIVKLGALRIRTSYTTQMFQSINAKLIKTPAKCQYHNTKASDEKRRRRRQTPAVDASCHTSRCFGYASRGTKAHGLNKSKTRLPLYTQPQGEAENRSCRRWRSQKPRRHHWERGGSILVLPEHQDLQWHCPGTWLLSYLCITFHSNLRANKIPGRQCFPCSSVSEIKADYQYNEKKITKLPCFLTRPFLCEISNPLIFTSFYSVI